MTLCLPLQLCCHGTVMQNFLCFARYLICHMSNSNFCSFQTKSVLPVISNVWSKMGQIVLEILKGYKDLCFCGDGPNDSPGHGACYCISTQMDNVTKVVVHWEVIDKMETEVNGVCSRFAVSPTFIPRSVTWLT